MAESERDKTQRECEEILGEHRRIEALIHDIAGTGDMDTLATELEGLVSLLTSHFAREESAEGLHAAIARDAAHAVPALDHLVSEHKVILATVQDIMGRVIGGSVNPERIEKELEDLFAVLRDHEQQETDLFEEVVCMDEGGSG